MSARGYALHSVCLQLSFFSFRHVQAAKMPRPRSGKSDVSDTDETFVEREQELERLKRHYRIMQNQREDYTEDSQNLIRKQK